MVAGAVDHQRHVAGNHCAIGRNPLDWTTEATERQAAPGEDHEVSEWSPGRRRSARCAWWNTSIVGEPGRCTGSKGTLRPPLESAEFHRSNCPVVHRRRSIRDSVLARDLDSEQHHRRVHLRHRAHGSRGAGHYLHRGRQQSGRQPGSIGRHFEPRRPELQLQVTAPVTVGPHPPGVQGGPDSADPAVVKVGSPFLVVTAGLSDSAEAMRFVKASGLDVAFKRPEVKPYWERGAWQRREVCCPVGRPKCPGST